VVWFTNLDHGRRHHPLRLMTMEQNIKFSKHKEIRGIGYQKYDNYDAIEVPYTIAIPSDYEGVMGVPVSFLDKYCPEQFEIVGWSRRNEFGMDGGYWQGGKSDATINGKEVYRRILIKHRKPLEKNS
ncbi:MAG: DNA methyltransferase, partial [Ignavibacteria bacterium]|nr:DNA methyltransferase [Ignavibacteria bacterium]